MFLNQNHTVCAKIEAEFLGKLENANVFSTQKHEVSKKKKVFTKIGIDFSAKIGNSNVFLGQKQEVSKKKKKRSSPKFRLNSRQNRKFKRFFGPKTGGLQKKKKRSSPKLQLIFRPKSEMQTLFHAESRHVLHNFSTQFPLGGGLFSIFHHQKSASKAPKTCDFAYFTSQWVGSSPPPPPL